MPQSVTRPNRILKNISKNQDIFHAIREFCTILSHRQRGSKSEITRFKELPGNLLVTKKLQTRFPIVKGGIVLRNDTVTKNVVVRCNRGTLCGPMRLRLGVGPEAAAGDEPSGAAWPCPIDLLEEAEGAAARGR